MPYTNDPANNVNDRIRLNVGDTDPEEEGLTDEVYDYIVEQNTDSGIVNEVQASLDALRLLVAKYASYITEKAGGLFAKESEKYYQYKDLLDEYSRNPSMGFMKSGAGFAGGISRSDMAENRADPDNNLNPFYLGEKSMLS